MDVLIKNVQTAAIESGNKVKMLNEVMAELARATGYKERLFRLAEMMVPAIADWCVVDIAMGNGGRERVAIVHRDQEKVKELRKINQKFGQPKKGWVSKAVITGRVQVINSIEEQMLAQMDLPKEQIERLINLEFGPGVVALLEARGRRLGTLSLMRDKGKAQYDKSEIEFIISLAAQAGILIDNSLLLEKANQQLQEQKKARKALEDSEAALRLALNAGRMGIWDWDINSGRVHLSRESEAMYGFAPGNFGGTLEELTGKIYIEDKGTALAEIRKAVQEKGNYYHEYRVAGKEGITRCLSVAGKVICDKSGVPLRLLGVVSDITERNRTEESLRISERKFKLIFQNAMDTIIIADNHGHILDVNPAGTKLWGKPAEEMMKMRMSDLAGENREEIISKWRNLREEETQVGEIVVTSAKGETKTLEYAATTNILPHQDLFIFRDITDRVIEEKRREHFLSIASHELRSPLASIKAFNYLAKKLPGVKDNEKASEHLAKIDDKVDIVARLISDLLDVTRIRQGKLEMVPEEFDFDEFMDEVVKEMQMTLHTHKISKRGRTRKIIEADKKKITQVAINLIRNAVKYSPKAKRVEIILGSDKDNVKVAIKDYGLGISKADKERVFELYYRGTDERKEGIRGLGVGLFISEQIIRQHKGKIWVESQKNKGSTFYFTLPIKHE